MQFIIRENLALVYLSRWTIMAFALGALCEMRSLYYANSLRFVCGVILCEF